MTITANFAQDAVNGACGSSSGGTFTTAPSTNLCTAGTATLVSGSGPWTWSCLGQYGGTDATSCSASIQTYTVTFLSGGNGTLSGTTSQTVNYGGSTSAVTANADLNYHFVNWTGSVTSSTNPLTVSNVIADMTITANFTQDAVNGSCGSSSGGTFTTAPSTNLCSAGTATLVSGSGPWTWSCNGANGGTNASCSAQVSQGKPPTANFGLSVSGLTANVNGTASSCSSHTCSYSWSTTGSGDIANSTAASTTITYPTGGTLTITLTATDSVSGSSTSITKNVTVTQANRPPAAAFASGSPSLGGPSNWTVSVTDNSTDPDGNLSQITVSWGDGGSSTVRSWRDRFTQLRSSRDLHDIAYRDRYLRSDQYSFI